jgi:hypothetical protein
VGCGGEIKIRQKVFNGRQLPKNLQTDKGREFYNVEFRRLVVDKYGVNHYSTQSNLKASIIERFNRTLKSYMWKQFSLQGFSASSKYVRPTLLTYLLEDFEKRPVKGGFYSHELQRVRHPDVYLVEKVLRKRREQIVR